MEEILIGQSDFELVVAMPDNLKFERLYNSILKAQRHYIATFLGNPLYYAVYSQQDVSPYSVLVQGAAYERGGKTYVFYGLKPAIACYAYAMYLNDNKIRVTRSGNMLKKSEFSEQATMQEVNAEIRKHLDEGAKYLYSVRDFLQANHEDYPDFENGQIYAGATISSIGHPRYKGNNTKAYGADGRMLSWNNENFD